MFYETVFYRIEMNIIGKIGKLILISYCVLEKSILPNKQIIVRLINIPQSCRDSPLERKNYLRVIGIIWLNQPVYMIW